MQAGHPYWILFSLFKAQINNAFFLFVWGPDDLTKMQVGATLTYLPRTCGVQWWEAQRHGNLALLITSLEPGDSLDFVWLLLRTNKMKFPGFCFDVAHLLVGQISSSLADRSNKV